MEAKQIFSRIAWAYVAYLLISVAVQTLFAIILSAVQMIIPGFEPGDSLILFLSMFSMYAVAFPVFYWLMSRIPAWHKTDGKALSFPQMVLLFLVCTGVSVIGNTMGNMLMIAKELFLGTEAVNPVTELAESMNIWTMVLFTVILAPAIEEVMFRKLLIDRLIPYGQGFAVMVSGISFGLFHGNFYQFFYACGLGMIFAYLYSCTGRIRYSLILHMVFNAVGGVLPLTLLRGVDAGSGLAYFGVLLLPAWSAVAAVGTIVIGCLYFKKLSWMKPWKIPEGGAGKALLKIPAVWAFFLVCLLQFLTA